MEQVYYNGKIITMTSSFPEAVLVCDGRIKAVGSLDSVKMMLSSTAEWIDLEGKCLMPSFIDSHSHIVMAGQMANFVDLSECESFADIIKTLKVYITKRNIRENGIVIGYGYDHNFLKEKRHPDKFVLDKVSTRIPILLLHVSAHMGCMNSAALNMSGINKYTGDPEGGMIGRVYDSAEPNGYAEESGLAIAQSAVQKRIHLDIAGMDSMQNIYIENGITTVQDGASTQADMQILKMLADARKLKIDVVAYPLITANGTELVNCYGDYDGQYQNHLKIGGYKIILDGSPQGRSAWLSQPYAGNADGYCGYPALDDDTVMNYVGQAVKEGKQILAHCNGDAASEQFLDIYEKCLADIETEKKLRPVMIHCQTVRKDQLDRMAKIGMIASMFVGHVWYWGDIHLENLGIERGNNISPVKDAIQKSVVVNFHQDTPVTKPNMLHTIWCAVNRLSRGGKIVGKEQRITVYEALKAVTIHAAYQYFEERDKGSIEVGKRADFVILDQSPLEVEKSEIKNIQVMETLKDGITLYKR